MNEAIDEGVQSASYSAVPASAASRRLTWDWQRRHAEGVSTGVAVMNPGNAPATVSLELFVVNSLGGPEPVPCALDCGAVTPPRASHVFWTPSIRALMDGTYGWAVLTSDVPVTAIVNTATPSLSVDMWTLAAVPLEE